MRECRTYPVTLTTLTPALATLKSFEQNAFTSAALAFHDAPMPLQPAANLMPVPVPSRWAKDWSLYQVDAPQPFLSGPLCISGIHPSGETPAVALKLPVRKVKRLCSLRWKMLP